MADKGTGDKKKLSGEVFLPTPEVVAQATVQNPDKVYEEAEKDLEGFWARRASELEWFKKWDKVLDESNKPFYKWFVGGKTNIVLNALDRHVRTWRRNKLALIWEGENGELPDIFLSRTEIEKSAGLQLF